MYALDLLKLTKGINMETMQMYVVRKLKEPTANLSEVAIASDVNLRTLYNIRDGNDALVSNVQKLNDYFKKAAD